MVGNKSLHGRHRLLTTNNTLDLIEEEEVHRKQAVASTRDVPNRLTGAIATVYHKADAICNKRKRSERLHYYQQQASETDDKLLLHRHRVQNDCKLPLVGTSTGVLTSSPESTIN